MMFIGYYQNHRILLCILHDFLWTAYAHRFLVLIFCYFFPSDLVWLYAG